MVKFIVNDWCESNEGNDSHDLFNKQAINFAEYNSRINKSTCDKHTNFINIVTVKPGLTGFKLELTYFCCEDFKGKFALTNK